MNLFLLIQLARYSHAFEGLSLSLCSLIVKTSRQGKIAQVRVLQIPFGLCVTCGTLSNAPLETFFWIPLCRNNYNICEKQNYL